MSAQTTDSGAIAGLFGKTRRALLRLFFVHPDRSLYVSEIVGLAGVGTGAVQRELRRLSKASIIEKTQSGRQVYYRANRRCPVFREIEALVVKTFGVVEVLAKALEPLRSRVRFAWVYGSFARGEQRDDSDVDLLVVGDVSFSEIVQAIGPAQQELEREINPTVYPTGEFIEKVRSRHYFIQDVLDNPKLFVIGDEDELGRLVESETAGEAPADSPGNHRPPETDRP